MSLPLEFGRPWALLLLLVLAPMGYLAWTTRAPLGGGRWWLSTVVRVALVLLVVLSLADLRWARHSNDLCVFFLVDGSKSTGPLEVAGRDESGGGSGRGLPKALAVARKQIVGELLQMKKGDRFGVIVFGQRPLLVRASSVRDTAFKFRPIDPQVGDFTNIGRAIRFAASQFPRGYQKRIVLLSDGNENLGDARIEARAAAAAEIDILTCPLAATYGADVVVSGMFVPQRARPNQPVRIKVRIESTRATETMVRVYRDGEAIAEGTVALDKGTNLIDVASDTVEEPGFYRWEVIVEPPAGSDDVVENNTGLAYTQVYGESRVLYLEGYPEHARRLRQALRDGAARGKGGFTLKTGSMRNVPSAIEDLAPYDCVILSDIPASAMSSDQMKLFQNYVKELGGGLIMIGGQMSLTTGGYVDTPIERILPVDLHLDREKHLASLALVIVVDQSGSMGATVGGSTTKMDLANQACANAISLLDYYDQAAVCMTDTSPKWVGGKLRYMTGPNKSRLTRDVLRNRPGGGGIFVKTGLYAAYEELKKSDAQSKHVILFADTRDSEQQNGCFKMADDYLRVHNITLTSIGLGDPRDPDVPFLRTLAERHGNGRFYITSNARDLPEIFTKDTYIVSRNAIVEVKEGFQAGQVGSAEMIDNIDWPSAPRLYGYVATRPRPKGEVLLVAKDDEPLLARWRYGLGKATVFASDAKDRWSKDWIGWGGFDKFWPQIVRWTMRQPRSRNIRTQTVVDGSRVRIIVDAIDSDGEFINGRMLSARVISPDPSAGVRKVALHQVGPGRYAGYFEAKVTQAVHQIGIVDDEAGRVVDSAGAVLSYPPEYRDTGPNLVLLQQLADLTRGRFVPGRLAGSFKRKERPASALRSAWVAMLVVGVGLLVVDVASRRLVLPDFLAGRRKRLSKAVGDKADQVMTRLRESRDLSRRRQERIEDLPVGEALLKHQDQRPTGAPRGKAALAGQGEVVELKRAKGKGERNAAPPSTTESLLAAKRRAQQRTKGFSDEVDEV
ncbi:MAG: VWA domain-containing protein [Anaerolineaceae bacterium]|nr:VWA domain-containing protein [Anaerolineaceae bacterium]